MQQDDAHTVVIGAGIIGLAIAFFLHAQGRKVKVIHRDPLDASTSCGNAGGVAVAEVVPLSGPGVLWSAPKWLMDPLGPLSIQASYLPKLLPWFWRFMGTCTTEKRRSLAHAMASLLKTAMDDHQKMLDTAGLGHLINKKGALFVYRSETGRKADRAAWDLRRDCGIAFDALDRQGVLASEPALGPLAVCGYRVEDWAHYRDPAELVTALAAYLRAQGVIFVQARVAAIEVTDSKASGVRLESGTIVACDQLVIAAGAWSVPLARQLGDPVLLESERGYNTTLPEPGVRVNSFVTFSEDYFVMTPMQMGLRIGGAVEFAGLDAAPNYKRSKVLLQLAKTYLPELHTQGGTEWMGNRPSTPDSLPVISRSSKVANVFYAFGHGHLGLTGSMTTGRLIADLVSDKRSNLDLSPFHIGRFS